MEVLSVEECRAWCAARNLVESHGQVHFGEVPWRALELPLPKQGLEIVGLSNTISTQVDEGEHPRTLLWLRDWGMWSESYEDVGMRLWEQLLSVYGVRSPSIRALPGLLFEEHEVTDQRIHLLAVLLFQWDAVLLPEHGAYVVIVSHDGYVRLIARDQQSQETLAQAMAGWGPTTTGDGQSLPLPR